MSDHAHTLPVAPARDTGAGDWARRSRGWSRGFVVAATVSALAHFVLFGLALHYLKSQPAGGGGQLLDAIEIEVVDAQALESTLPAIAHAGGGAALSDATGSTSATASTSLAAAAAPPPPPSDAVELPPEPRDADLVAGASQPRRTTDTQPTVAIDAPPTSPQFESASPSPTAASDAGGSTTSAPAASAPSPAAAAASPGEVARFNAAVRKALAANRPKRGWPSGRVLIAFSVSDAGHVENAELVESSANTRLNQLTLAWITAIAMPEPPRGLALADRRYAIPVTVK